MADASDDKQMTPSEALKLITATIEAQERGERPSAEETKRLATAYRLLEERGHELAPEELPELPEGHRKALEEARPKALANALEVLKDALQQKKEDAGQEPAL